MQIIKNYNRIKFKQKQNLLEYIFKNYLIQNNNYGS